MVYPYDVRLLWRSASWYWDRIKMTDATNTRKTIFPCEITLSVEQNTFQNIFHKTTQQQNTWWEVRNNEFKLHFPKSNLVIRWKSHDVIRKPRKRTSKFKIQVMTQSSYSSFTCFPAGFWFDHVLRPHPLRICFLQGCNTQVPALQCSQACHGPQNNWNKNRMKLR